MDVTLLIFIVAVVALAVGALCGYFVARMRTIASETLLSQAQSDLERAESELAECRKQNTSLQAENARLQEQLRQETEERKNLRAESELVFRELASSIFEEKAKVIRESHNLQLGEILTSQSVKA